MVARQCPEFSNLFLVQQLCPRLIQNATIHVYCDIGKFLINVKSLGKNFKKNKTCFCASNNDYLKTILPRSGIWMLRYRALK